MAFISRIISVLFHGLVFLVLGLFALVLLLGAAVLVANWNDEPLDSELKNLLSERPPQIDPQRNGYFAWIGIMGPESTAPQAWGQRWYQEALAIDAALRLKDSSPNPAADAERRKSTWPKGGPCRRPDTCFADVAADPAKLRVLLEEARPTLARADAAVAYAEVQEPVRPNITAASPMPSYPSDWLAASAARFVFDVREGRHDTALARLAGEHRFHLAHAAGAASLLDKVVAISYLRGDYLLLADYLHRHPDAAREHIALIDAILKPLPEAALSLTMVLRNESKAVANLMLNLPNTSPDGQSLPAAKRMMWVIFQPQASANAAYRSFADSVAVESLTGEAYRSAIAAVRRTQMKQATQTPVWRRLHISNPVGRILLSIGSPNFESYWLRRDDLRVLHAALALRVRLLKAGRPVSDMAALATAPELVHPFTRASPHWDEQAQALAYPASELLKDKEALSIKL